MNKIFDISELDKSWGDQFRPGACHLRCVRRSSGAKNFLALPARHRQHAFTIIEVIIAMVIVGVIAAVAIPMYNDYIERTRIAQVKADIADMGSLIAQFQSDNLGQLPNSLADIGKAALLDPWGNPYKYLNLSTMNGNGQVRKDKNLVPINSDYDLYSSGNDGISQGPLTAAASRDDIVRANNGRFIGLASDY